MSLALLFLFGLYTLCGDILRTARISGDTMPSIFVLFVHECYELPMTMVSVLWMSRAVEALAGKNWKFFLHPEKLVWHRWMILWLCALILSGVIVLVGRFCERYGVVDEMYSIFLLNNALAIQGKGFVLAWGCRLLGFLNGALFLGMFIRSNRCLSILLLLIYFVFGLLLMLGTPPVVCLPNQTP